MQGRGDVTSGVSFFAVLTYHAGERERPRGERESARESPLYAHATVSPRFIRVRKYTYASCVRNDEIYGHVPRFFSSFFFLLLLFSFSNRTKGFYLLRLYDDARNNLIGILLIRENQLKIDDELERMCDESKMFIHRGNKNFFFSRNL